MQNILRQYKSTQNILRQVGRCRIYLDNGKSQHRIFLGKLDNAEYT